MFLILHLKYYIFSKKLEEKLPMVNDFVYKFKFILQVERNLSGNICKPSFTVNELKNAFQNCSLLFE